MNMLRTVAIARKTLDAIDRAIDEDGGASFRVWQGRVLPHIGDAYRGEDGGHRTHLGASIVGRECARELWYSFRWSRQSEFEPRILRLFNRGHLEEGRFIAMLLAAGIEVYQQDEEGNQFRISSSGGHFGGSGDGKAIGVPDLPPGETSILEFKTHGEKSFIKLAGKLPEWRDHVAGRGPFTGEGVRFAKFEHFVQMQIYMRKMGIASALYMAVNKNTDDVYAEILSLDEEVADQFLDRGDQIIAMKTPPKKINESSGFFKCRFCDMRPVCHMGEDVERNCRTCEASEPAPDGSWRCRKHKITLSKEAQAAGCDDYDKNRAL